MDVILLAVAISFSETFHLILDILEQLFDLWNFIGHLCTHTHISLELEVLIPFDILPHFDWLKIVLFQ